MPPSAAQLVTTLVAKVCTLDSNGILLGDMLNGLDRLGVQVQQALANSPDATQVAALDRATQAGARQLSTLGSTLAARCRNAAAVPSATLHLLAACKLAIQLATIARASHLSDSTMALHDCVTLPLECGRALMAGLSGSGSVGSPEHCTALEQEITLLYHLIVLPGRDAAATEHLGAKLTPPEPLLAWLSSVANVLLITMRGPWLGTGSPHRAQAYLFSIINTITSKKGFAAHAAAIQRDNRLQHSLVQLLISALHRAATEVQLPSGRRPASFTWRSMGIVAKLLSTVPLRLTFIERLEQPGFDGSSSSQRVLHNAAQLLLSSPASCPEGTTMVEFGQHWFSLFRLLGTASSSLYTRFKQQQQQGQAPPPAAHQQRMLAQMLLALPQLPAAIRAVHQGVAADAGEGFGEVTQGALMVLDVAYQCFFILDLFRLLAFPNPDQLAAQGAAATGIDSTLGSLAEVPAWCAAGSALLQSLPHVAAMLPREELASDQAGRREDPQLAMAAIRLTFTVLEMASAIRRFCEGIGDEGPRSAAQGVAAGKALWQLHTAVCRCVHSVAAGSLPLAGNQVKQMLGALDHSMAAALYVNDAVKSETDNHSSTNASNAKPRHLLAMSVAHAEAALVAATVVQPSPDDALLVAAVSLELVLSAVQHGPGALASSAPVRQALEQQAEQCEAAEGSNSATADYIREQLATLALRESQPGDALELAQAAAARSCAYLRCANLAGEGAPAAGKGAGSKRCSKCRVVWYCGTTCSHAAWRAGHRKVCQALGAAKVVEQQAQGQQQREA